MPDLPAADIHLRSYGAQRESDRHAFAQLVLPVAGTVLLDIEGHEGRLDPLHGALVAPGAWHAQCGTDGNRSVIVDIGDDSGFLAQGDWQRLLERPFTPLAAAARKLVEYMALMHGTPALRPALVHGWVPLLLDALAQAPAQPRSRLAALCAGIEAGPGQPWTTASMARYAGVSISRLHALFREELDATPHAWLMARRLGRACEWLAAGSGTIAEVALAAGFTDQSALTRAMRAALGTTPAAYRRASQENGARTREESPRK
ncbi:helix-turn-helix transcriptional regulator [Pseudoduganella umbonata]|uniref:AraC-like DNA-binding protein n=1 Tax=Pseudoduganella umbonata TaxID=864828 RepID=A0A4P8HXC1_9BURK|nr:AraC family transcriptional regulator [Pseudoduganella umbonata]MBB3223065.1 AraC-like DNA-binding protein [Pseudoduganella umbonata]QCP13164.1 helix-turn-helix transcriptional regulator [Pseudoduganella umbonata]